VYLKCTGSSTYTASIRPFYCALLQEEFGGKDLILYLPLLHVTVHLAKASYQFTECHMPQDGNLYVATAVKAIPLQAWIGP
jgi:hypothetical protein